MSELTDVGAGYHDNGGTPSRRTMPAQRPGLSKQDYSTPVGLITAVKARLGISDFVIDLAADVTNHKAHAYLNIEDDALSMDDWAREVRRGWGWLNPPFGKIDPWAERCLATRERGGSVAFLVPASVGSDWFKHYIHRKALVLALNGRLCFIKDWQTTVDPSPRNTTGAFYKSAPLYPKDTILCLFSPSYAPDFDVWNWRER